jgi:hypothetical protein
MNVSTLFLSLILVTQLGGLQPGTGIVTGVLKNTDGKPAAGVRVAAISVDDPAGENLLSIDQTDAAGRYGLSNIPQGLYYIVAGRVGSLTYYPGGAEPANAQKLVVEPARVISNINFVVPTTAVNPSAAKSSRSREVLDYVAIQGERDLGRKLSRLQKFQKDYPRSDIMSNLFPILMEVYVSQQQSSVAASYVQKILRGNAENVIALIAESHEHALQADFAASMEVAERAVSAAEKLKSRRPPAPYTGPAWDAWVGIFEGKARTNLAAIKRLTAPE